MTTSIRVVDASALVAVMFDEEESDALSLRITNVRLAAPALLPFEVGNVCLKKMRAAPALSKGLREMLQTFSAFGIELHGVDLDGVTLLALDLGLSAYDASYLWLARHLGAELVTLDKKLLAASKA